MHLNIVRRIVKIYRMEFVKINDIEIKLINLVK